MCDKENKCKSINYYIDTEIPTTNASIVHVMKMCQAFTRNGINVTLFCNGKTEKIDLDGVFQQYAIEDRFKIVPVHIPDFLRDHGHRFGAYYSAWKKSRFKVKNSYAYSRSAMSLFFLKNQAEYIYEAHLEPDVINRQIERNILKHKNCKGLVVISNALKKRYLEMFPFLNEEKVTVLHDAADIDWSESNEKAVLKGEEDSLRIGYVGSLFPGKCMETLLPLACACPQYQFHVVGGSEYWLNHWQDKAKEAQADNLIFYGFVDNSKVGDFYRAFDICILPFSKDVHIGKNKRVNIGRWTSPLKLFEAMAYAKPIIVSGLETIEEVMTNYEDCIMVEPDNIEDWKIKLNEICMDETLRERIGYAAQCKLKKEYTWLERAKRAAELFDE